MMGRVVPGIEGCKACYLELSRMRRRRKFQADYCALFRYRSDVARTVSVFSASLQDGFSETCTLDSLNAMLACAFVYFGDWRRVPVYGRNQPSLDDPLIGRSDWVGASGKGSEWVEFKKVV
jgi:hypothetical protein